METFIAIGLILFVILVIGVAIARLMASVGGEIITGINRTFESPKARETRIESETIRREFSKQLHRQDAEHHL